jgi:hypothetical protein
MDQVKEEVTMGVGREAGKVMNRKMVAQVKAKAANKTNEHTPKSKMTFCAT